MCYYLYILSSFVFIVFTKQTSNQEANKRKINCILITLNFAVFFPFCSPPPQRSLSLSHIPINVSVLWKCTLLQYLIGIYITVHTIL